MQNNGEIKHASWMCVIVVDETVIALYIEGAFVNIMQYITLIQQLIMFKHMHFSMLKCVCIIQWDVAVNNTSLLILIYVNLIITCFS